MPALSAPQLEALKKLVVDVFDRAELEQLTGDRLGQRLDVIVPLDKAFDAVVFDLIEVVERRGWTEELVRGVYEERKDKPEVRQFCEVNAPFVFTPRASNKDLAQAVGTGL